tara:strand:+ start:6370 stop:8364 length:1995 start_codon:yes stop_codon:yes gene_type:complete
MLVEFGKASLLGKARLQPDRVSDVVNKIKTDGLIPTVDAVKSKLEQPIPLGYSNVGIVQKVGDSITKFKVGDRVVSNGSHAEYVAVSENLCCLIPDNVSDTQASFTVLGSIALQGIRLAQPSLGETFLVVGLGLIGLLTVQLLKANGCKVLALDVDPSRCKLAEIYGCSTICLSEHDDPVGWAHSQTDGIGVDGVIVTASTSSSEPIHLSAQASRQRGRIILVGVSGLEIRRDLFYKKELTFQVSCSYGPGRYDQSYELYGNDYPIGFVRWTEQRNFQAVVHALSVNALLIDELVSHTFSIDSAAAAYDLLNGKEPTLGILLSYPNDVHKSQSTVDLSSSSFSSHSQRALADTEKTPSISFIGAGNYASRTLIPAFARTNAQFITLAGSSGLSPVFFGKKYGFQNASTDTSSVISDSQSSAIVIATRHDSHAKLVLESLNAGKHVFVEKPLCLTLSQLDEIKSASLGSNSVLTVGYNRRFAPSVVYLKKYLTRSSSSKTFIYTCNAGYIPADHWIHDSSIGGGRLLGEACHFVDLLRFLSSSAIASISCSYMDSSSDNRDTFTLSIKFLDGSLGLVHYFSNGDKSFPKERIEVFDSGKVFQLDNFRKLRAWGVPGFKTRKYFTQDKGHNHCASAFVNAISCAAPPPIPLSEIFDVQHQLLSLFS